MKESKFPKRKLTAPEWEVWLEDFGCDDFLPLNSLQHHFLFKGYYIILAKLQNISPTEISLTSLSVRLEE